MSILHYPKSFTLKSVEELIEKAVTTTDKSLLELLALSPSMNVRRAVARNVFTSSEVLGRLTSDPVMNVSYCARNNSSYFGVRRKSYEEELGKELHKCITCQIPENIVNCTMCKK